MKKIIAIAGFIGVFASLALNVSAGYFNSAPIARCDASIVSNLSYGRTSHEVTILQSILMAAGYLQATPNGYFGYQTKAAVKNFQLDNGITPTGSVGPQTREAINELLCDGSFSSYNTGYSYGSGVTVVAPTDPFVTVINPPLQSPVVYATPQTNVYSSTVSVTGQAVATPVVQMSSSYSPSSIASTQVVYSPSIGYTYGITPSTGSVTVSSPTANAVYNEGDTVFVNWGTNNLVTYSFNIVLESNISGQSKIVGTTSGNSYSFVLTRALLEEICSGTCNNNQTGSFKILVTTPTTDIAGNTSTLRAAIAPITIRRPLGNAQVTVTGSKTPVNSGEIFKLYINVPTNNAYGYNNADMYGTYSVRIRAVCPPSVTASIAGVACGQEFTIPSTVINAQQEIPAIITNGTWYKQDVTFQVTVVNLANQVIGTAETKVSVNALPFGF